MAEVVVLEVPHGPYRFDVAVTHGGRVVYGFEVFFKHQVPAAKAALGVLWLELLAEDILAYRLRIPWTPDGRARQDVRCPSCEALSRELQKRAAADQKRSQMQTALASESRQVKDAWLAVLGQASAGRVESKT